MVRVEKLTVELNGLVLIAPWLVQSVSTTQDHINACFPYSIPHSPAIYLPKRNKLGKSSSRAKRIPNLPQTSPDLIFISGASGGEIFVKNRWIRGSHRGLSKHTNK
jgi:hypothetical protein